MYIYFNKHEKLSWSCGARCLFGGHTKLGAETHHTNTQGGVTLIHIKKLEQTNVISQGKPGQTVAVTAHLEKTCTLLSVNG